MLKKPSKKKLRQDKILDALALNPSKRVNTLAKELGVSTETVRRDLADLDESGQIERTYGGAVRTIDFEPALAERLKLYIQERERIARHAVSMIGEASSIFIGGGATTLHFARALKSIDRKITVFTATFSIATELATNPLVEVMSLPGVVEPKEGLVYGSDTVNHIARYKASFAIMGASAVDEAGVSEALLNAAEVYTAMAKSADRTIVLADRSKFELRSLQMVLNWSSTTTIITDSPPSPRLRDSIETQGTMISVASSN